MRLCHAHRWLRHLANREWPDGALAARYAFRHALYQRALYDSLSPSRRASLHERIGQRLEAGYAGRTAEASGELAKHSRAAAIGGARLVYLEQAATRAYDRRAYRDVVACLEPALRLLADTPDTPERARDELRMRQLYSVVLSQIAGYVRPRCSRTSTRTRSLSRAAADTAGALRLARARVPAQRQRRGPRARGRRSAENCRSSSERPDPSAVLQSSFLQGESPCGEATWTPRSLSWPGRWRRRSALEEADRPYGVNPVVAARSFEGLRRWLVGDPVGARAVQQEALALAERNGRPFTVAHAAMFGRVSPPAR